MITVVKYDLEGNFLEEITENNYNCIAIKEKIDPSSLMNNLEGTVLSCERFQYKPLNNRKVRFHKIPPVWNINNLGKSNIFGKYYNKNLITTYQSIVDASEKNKIDIAAISRCLSNKNKTAGGFQWKYLN